MRAHQLVRVIKPHLRQDISLQALPYKVTDNWSLNNALFGLRGKAIVILLKSLAYRLSPTSLETLRDNTIALGVDHIDGDLALCRLGAFDFHISASLTGHAALKTLCAGTGQYVGYLLHHPDPRIRQLRFAPLPDLQAMYLGGTENLFLPEPLRRDVTVIEATRNAEMVKALPRLPDFNFHYSVRPTKATTGLERAYKPFTKGANAAACQSNIMINRGADDVTEFLGEDYPYLCRDNDLGHIEEVFRHAQESFGSADWQRGLARMDELRNRTSPTALARQLEEIVDNVT